MMIWSPLHGDMQQSKRTRNQVALVSEDKGQKFYKYKKNQKSTTTDMKMSFDVILAATWDR